MNENNFIMKFITRKKTYKDYLLLFIAITLTIILYFNYDYWVVDSMNKANPELCNRSYEIMYENKNTTAECYKECFDIYGCKTNVSPNGRLYQGTCVCDGITLHHKDMLGLRSTEYFFNKYKDLNFNYNESDVNVR